ncbi:HK97 family phage major capsid protein [Rhizobium sp. SG_E_25_P2]|uniref:phage major capsid protein n=1 Tax=Rhizobium sp. SG_E_25_P2 TaxID=2879942 RepID=UPI002472FF76|nr:phage major capsid protein [Rhizobium sp. SG_E_25_P2]MDH6265530.1 HK97 family phage major capsid protein [Rhizobium sp. SG_E_25_P2]
MSVRIKELREKQATHVAEARERLDQIGKTTDEARAKELETQHDAAMAEYDRLEKLIEREERFAVIEKSVAEREEESRAARRPGSKASIEGRGTDEGESKLEYRSVFHKFLREGADISAMSTEERAVLKSGIDERAAVELRAQTAGTTTAGGFTVPTELDANIIRSMKAWGPMYDEDICTTISTASGSALKLPTVDDTAVTAVSHTEATALTDTGAKDVTFGQKSLDAYVFDTQFVRWSMELSQDSIINVEALLASLLAERLGRIANSQLTIGSGSSAPNGVVTAATLGKTAAATGAITWDEIIDLEHSVDPAYRTSPKARYMFNDSTLQACRKLKDGQGNYLWQMGDVQKGVPGSFNGRPYSINQAMAPIATGAKTVLFGDFGKYFVRKVGGITIGVLRERFWPDLGIAGLIRFDGELGDSAAIKYLQQA